MSSKLVLEKTRLNTHMPFCDGVSQGWLEFDQSPIYPAFTRGPIFKTFSAAHSFRSRSSPPNFLREGFRRFGSMPIVIYQFAQCIINNYRRYFTRVGQPPMNCPLFNQKGVDGQNKFKSVRQFILRLEMLGDRQQVVRSNIAISSAALFNGVDNSRPSFANPN
jgi:hypothetical protein